MLRVIPLFAIALIVAVIVSIGASTACSRDRGPPRVRTLQHPDGVPALRGPARAPARSPRNASYKIDARLDPASHQITATETLTWVNTSASPVSSLPFHLYLNAFKNDQSLFMRTSEGVMRGARASDTNWGWIHVTSIKIGGVEQLAHFKTVPADGAPQDETVAELALATPIEHGDSVVIQIAFTDQLPEVFARTGFKGEFNMVGQWFPKIGVRVGAPGFERWECQPLHINSEFFADFGVYDVTLTVPTTHVVAATGVLTASSESPGGTRTLTYHAEDVHDFAWMADPWMDMIKGTAKVEGGTVEVRVYFRVAQREFAERHLQAAIGTIERMSAWFIPYPWSIMTVIDPPVEAAAGAGGMEYPTLVTTAGDTVLARPGIRLPEYVTVHEVGHNWFQGMLASDEANEAWLDEGVNEWADAKVMDDLYGPRSSFIDWQGWQGQLSALMRAVAEDPASVPSPIATASYAFVDNNAYGVQSYLTTSRALATLERTEGSARFMAAIKTYVQTWAFRHPTGTDLFDTLSHQLGEDLSWYFGPVFGQVGGMALGVRTARCWPAHRARGVDVTVPAVAVSAGSGAGSASTKTVTEADAPDTTSWTCEVVVTSTGTMHVPVDIELRFADGSTAREHWDDRGTAHWQRFELERSARLTEVRLDPDGKILLDQPITHQLRLDGDGAASLRAAARISGWAQTLMQVVGP